MCHTVTAYLLMYRCKQMLSPALQDEDNSKNNKQTNKQQKAKYKQKQNSTRQKILVFD